MTPKVSAIIANWNGAHHLRICLPSLRAQTYGPLEIIVVDNGSTDESQQVTRESGAKWLPLQKNTGLAPALNRGAAIAAGEMLLFVNNDMRFDPAFVSQLVAPLAEDSGVFATDGMQFNWDGTAPAHMATRLSRRNSLADGTVQLIPGLYFYPQYQAKPIQVFMGSAACLLVRKAYFDKLGGFDERLFLGYEDVDICWRAWLHHWKVVYVPEAVCWHRVGSSGRSAEGARMNFCGILTGRLLLATKLLPVRYAIWTWLVSTAGVVRDLTALRWQFVKERIGVLIKVWGMIPQLIRERHELFSRSGKSPQAHLDFLLKLTYGD